MMAPANQRPNPVTTRYLWSAVSTRATMPNHGNSPAVTPKIANQRGTSDLIEEVASIRDDRLLRSEQISLNLPRRGFWQLRHKSKIVRTFELRHARAEPAVNFAVEPAAGTNHARPQDDIRDRLHQPYRIGLADDRALRHRRMPHQSVFHFAGRDPHPGDLHHVVRAPAIMKIAIGVAREFISGDHPAVVFGFRGQLRVLPVLGEGARAFHPQIP